ncbi:MAG: HU family DNA-binding protein [Treponema sp.]|jgi:integration host factor subunit beta|nr:HU family DNA-binding protein [Treponema sp.]
MAVNKFTKADIVDAVYEKTGMNRKDIGAVIDLFIGEVKAALMKRHVIELRGFGTFEIKMRKARLKARNPRTGEIISIRPHGNVAFRPGRELKQDAWTITDEDLSSP